jgi:hypothetical protein
LHHQAPPLSGLDKHQLSAASNHSHLVEGMPAALDMLEREELQAVVVQGQTEAHLLA